MTTTNWPSRIELELADWISNDTLVLNWLGVATVSGRTNPTSLLEYHLVKLSTINWSSNNDMPFVLDFQDDPTLGDHNDEREKADWSS